MKYVKFSAALLLVFTCTLQSKAWGVLGHRITAEIAESYLTKKAKKNISAILGNETMAMASNWMDFIKSDSTYDDLYGWHYINIDGGMPDKAINDYLAKDTAKDSYTRIIFCIQQLNNRNVLTAADRLLYLRILIHIAGDMHQPLHTGHSKDEGGNKIKVSWFNVPTNLHTVWDEKLVSFQTLSYTEYAKAINFTTPEERKAWQSEPISAWVLEAYHKAEDIYAEITEPDQKLSYKYNFRHVATVNHALLKGGVQLAGVLNHIFG